MSSKTQPPQNTGNDSSEEKKQDQFPDYNLDYSKEVHLSRSPLMRGILVICGSLCLGLGILGIFLPVLPTTPLLLLAATCYAHSSTRFYNWLMNNRYFGHYIHSWRVYKSVPLKAKILTVIMIVGTMGLSGYYVPLLWVKIMLVVIGAGVIAYVLSLKTSR